MVGSQLVDDPARLSDPLGAHQNHRALPKLEGDRAVQDHCDRDVELAQVPRHLYARRVWPPLRADHAEPPALCRSGAK